MLMLGWCLGDAGVAVSSMMFGTTVLIYLVMLMIWETNFFLATAFLLFFGFIDLVYTSGVRSMTLLHHRQNCSHADRHHTST